MPELPPPGWYADADDSNYQRWWDGGVWTEHRRPMPDRATTPANSYSAVHPAAAPPIPSMGPVVPTEQDQARLRRARTLGTVGIWLFGAAVVLAVAGGLVYALNFLLILTALLVAPAATVLGIIAIVLATRSLSAGFDEVGRRSAKTALTLGIVSATAIIVAPVVGSLV